MMNVKKKLSNIIVFASVFAGTIIGAGIAFITASAPGKKVSEKLRDTAQKIKEDVNDQIQSSSVKIIENSAHLEKMAKTKIEDINVLIQSVKKNFKDSFDAERHKFGK